MDVDELYQEIILEHFKHPRNRGSAGENDIVLEGRNPFCGDEIRLAIKFNGRTLDRVVFEGTGCAISQASASMMTEMLKGKTVEQVKALIEDFSKLVKGRSEEVNAEQLGDLMALKGVCDYPTRVKCALLAWRVVEQGLEKA
jgi:nitrogen fixation NifU-like protein